MILLSADTCCFVIVKGCT